DNREYVIKTSYLLFAVLLILLILILGGHGFLWSQHYADWPVRSAVYRDLVNNDWPVVFLDNSFLCYYFGYFLPPAFISKFLFLFVKNAVILDKAMMIVELLWGTYITFLAFLLILDYIHKRSSGFKDNIAFKELLIVLFIFIFFSGLDIIGSVFLSPPGRHVFDWKDNLDVWSYKVFPCVVSNLWDAFNQGIMFYLASILIFMQEDMTIIMYLAGVSFISMIFPLLGLALLCIPLLIKRIKYIKELITIPNIVGIIALVSSVLFIISQRVIIDSATSGCPIKVASDLMEKWVYHIEFLILEFYIYFILLFKKHYKDPVFIISGISALLFIIIEYEHGTWEVFLRCSMPAIFCILVLSAKEMIDFYHDRKVELARVALVVCLVIGVWTPACDIARNVDLSMKNGWVP
ncbi:MAG: hypothetical protein MJ151_04115, partial [Lachnospiraceae bacterium]|nr:hypothetical protein [Lachnospiraceae bacterium]